MYRDTNYTEPYRRAWIWQGFGKTFGMTAALALCWLLYIAVRNIYTIATRSPGDPVVVARKYMAVVYNEHTDRIICRRVTKRNFLSRDEEVNRCTVFLQTRTLTLECDYPTTEQPGCTEQ